MLFNVFFLIIGAVASARHLYETSEQVDLIDRSYDSQGLNPVNKRRNIQHHDHYFHQIQLSVPSKFDPSYRAPIAPGFYVVAKPPLIRPKNFETIERENEFPNNKRGIETQTYPNLPQSDGRKRPEIENSSPQTNTGHHNKQTSRDNRENVTQNHQDNSTTTTEKSEYYENHNQSIDQQDTSKALINKQGEGHVSNKNRSDSSNHNKNTGQETMTSRKIKEPNINQANTPTAKSIPIGGTKLFSNKDTNETNSNNNSDGDSESTWVWGSSDGKLETTTILNDLDNRDAFKADNCASGQAKVGGMCVTSHN